MNIYHLITQYLTILAIKMAARVSFNSYVQRSFGLIYRWHKAKKDNKVIFCYSKLETGILDMAKNSIYTVSVEPNDE